MLAAGGALVLIWNVRPDGSPAWVEEFYDLADSGAAVHDFDDTPLHPLFAEPRRFEVAWTEEISRDQLLERATTWSSVATLPEAARTELLSRAGRLLDTHPELAGRELLAIPHTALAFRYQVSTIR